MRENLNVDALERSSNFPFFNIQRTDGTSGCQKASFWRTIAERMIGGVMPVSKKKSNNEIERLAMRVPAALKEKYARAASLRGETFSGWAKTVLDEAAERQIREHEFTDLSKKDRLAFVEAVLNPPAPSEAAINAAKRYKKVFGS